MSIDFTKSGMNKWSLIGLFVIMVACMSYYSIKAYNAPYNESLRLGEFMAYDSGDTDGYIAPIEQFIQTGIYEVGNNEDKLVGRGPYYGVYYFLFRLFLPVAKAYDAVAILQIIWYALAIIVLMLIVEPYVKYKFMVWIIPLLTCFLRIGFTYLPRILTDPIAVCQLLCFAYFYVQFNKEGKHWQLWCAALFLAMASVMKPYLLLVYAICFLDWAISNRVLDIKRWIKYIAIMSVPLVIICLPFTIRNAVKLHTFAPVQNSTYAGGKPDPVNAAMRKMVRVWGENHVEWGGLGTYFMPCEGFTYKDELPSHIYTKAYDKADIIALADKCREYMQMSEGVEKDSISAELVETMTGYRAAYIAEHPLWRVRASFMQMMYMTLPAESFAISSNHPGLRGVISTGINLITWLLTWLLFIFGTIGLIFIAIRNNDMRILAWLTFYHVLFFALSFAGEPRYYWIGRLMILVGFVTILDNGIKWLMNKNR